MTQSHWPIMIVLIFSLFGCFQKKPKRENLESWLETHFPGQFTIVENIVDLDPKNFFYKKVSTIVADRHDEEVQIRINWYKKEEGLGLSKEAIQQSLDQARTDVASARVLYNALKEAGLDSFSVAVVDMAAYILTFTEPDDTLRAHVPELLLRVLHHRPDIPQQKYWVECLEPTAYEKEFKQIVPFGYWQRGDRYHETQKIMSLIFDYTPQLTSQDLHPLWQINPFSSRSDIYTQNAYAEAKAWAAKHLKGEYYLEGEHLIQYGPGKDDPMTIEYSFPLYARRYDPDTPELDSLIQGYITGTYHSQRKTFTHIRSERKE